jgi:hypothetical protein
MRLENLLFLVPVALGCSSASSPSSTSPGDDESTGDAAVDGAGGDAQGSGEDAADVQAGDTGTSGPNAQSCAACTATDCLSALESCGSSQSCLSALQEFNTCYGEDPTAGATCGATLASTGTDASDLWSCLSSKCHPSCG